MLCVQYSTYIINLVNGEYLRIECLCESQLLTALQATCPEQVLEGDSLPGSMDGLSGHIRKMDRNPSTITLSMRTSVSPRTGHGTHVAGGVSVSGVQPLWS